VDNTASSRVQASLSSESISQRAQVVSTILSSLRPASEKQLVQYTELLHLRKVLERGLRRAFARMEVHMPLIMSLFKCDPLCVA
jgi:hypothetical protein